MTDTLLTIALTVLAVIGAFWGGQRKARKETEERLQNEYEAETARRIEAGREAIGHGRASGRSNDERVRDDITDW